MDGSDTSCPRVLIFGGDGGRSGVPRHLTLLGETLADYARLTVVSDLDQGGYAPLRQHRLVTHHQVEGLRNRAGLVQVWQAWRGMTRHLDAGRWDVIWLHERRPALLLRVALALRLWRPCRATRIVLSYHGIPFDPGHRAVIAMLSRSLERWLLRFGPSLHLVFLTRDMVLRLEKAVGARALARHHVHVLPNSSNIGALPFGPGSVRRGGAARHLVITGRAGYQKNYGLAVRLMAHLPPEFHLTLCGTGTESVAFQERVMGPLPASVRQRIRFAGSVEDVRPLLASADGYILTSRYEGLPIGAIEAFEAGLPVILSPFESAPEIVASHPMATLLAFADLPRDARRIVALVEQYRSNRPANAARIRRAWGRKYPYEKWQERLRALFNDILNDRVAGG